MKAIITAYNNATDVTLRCGNLVVLLDGVSEAIEYCKNNGYTIERIDIE